MNIRHLNIEVTKRCNQRCFYCFNNSGSGSSADEYAPTQWLDILNQLKNTGLESIHLTGGEPFAYKGVMELLAGAQAIGLRTSILSNGYQIASLCRDYSDIFRKLDVAQISLDSIVPEVQNLRRGNLRAWNDAVSAIYALRDIGVAVEVSSVVSEESIESLRAIARFCKEVGAALLPRPMENIGRAVNVNTHSRKAAIAASYLDLPVPVVDDRYFYVADENREWPDNCPKDNVTVHYDGKLRTHGAPNYPNTITELALCA